MSNGLYYSGDFSESMQGSAWPMHQLSRQVSDFDDPGVCFESVGLEKRRDNDSAPRKRTFQVAVDGGTGIRLVLHQSITMPIARTSALYPYLYRFVDLKKAYKILYPKNPSSFTLPEMMAGEFSH